jgi:uncharacterized protein YkwD
MGRRRFAFAWPALVLTLIAAHQPARGVDWLDELRGQALTMLNESRREHGLPSLQQDTALTQAAQRHAEDMLREGYFSHLSPSGKTIRDRYVASGSRASYVAENIAQCSNCRLDHEQIAQLHQGWMNSPQHRANILAHGLEGFGFGVAVDGSRIYAVQAFAGPGTTPGAEATGEGPPLDMASQLALAVDLINRERQAAGAEPLQGNEALSQTLATQAGEVDLQKEALPPVESIVEALPAEQQGRFGSMALLATECGGCGRQPTEADIRFFIVRWLDSSQYRGILLDPSRTHFGLAVTADGIGRKVALGIVAGS